MTTIKCPAPNCDNEWPADTPTDILTRLLDIHSATAHAAPARVPAPTSAAKAEKVRRPVVSAAGTSETWAYFVQRWTDYKQATHLSGSDIVFQLLECCDEELRKDLTRTYGALASSDEETVLKNIKTLAVRKENIMVARVQLQQMRQDRDEPVRAFAARLRGQAGVCNFSIRCPSDTCGNSVQRCQPHSLTKLTIFKIWQEDFEVGRKILRKCIKHIKLATNCASQAASNTIYTYNSPPKWFSSCR